MTLRTRSGHRAVQPRAKDLGDLVGGQPPQAEFAAAFEQLVDGKVALEERASGSSRARVFVSPTRGALYSAPSSRLRQPHREWAEKGVRKEDHVVPWQRRMARKRVYGVYYIFKSMEQGPTFWVSVPK